MSYMTGNFHVTCQLQLCSYFLGKHAGIEAHARGRVAGDARVPRVHAAEVAIRLREGPGVDCCSVQK